MQHQQPAALALGGQPQAFGIRVDGNAFEHRVEVQQHAAGARLAHQRIGQRQPLRGTGRTYLKHRGMGLADQIAIAQGVAAEPFEVHLPAAHLAADPGAYAHAPGQAAVRWRRQLEALRLGLPGRGAGIQTKQLVVLAIGHGPQRIAAPGQAGEVAVGHAFQRMLAEQLQFHRCVAGVQRRRSEAQKR
ncbi:hypothetical protein BAY1663_02198 [Pseudomonas sp. BAY1663]|nr:hypothetical protein BAY1663_02198 [Pseudomonas sp. BAY1663]